MLGVLIPRAGRLMSRDQLLSALAARDEEPSDRNVDFIVHRLRRKLNDTARSPRFIATQYGEGYVWVAQPAPGSKLSDFLVVGPVRCREVVREQGLVDDLLIRLREGLQRRAGALARVVTRSDPGDLDTARFRYALEVTFLAYRGRIDAALALRDQRAYRLVSVNRLQDVAELANPALAEVLDAIMGAIWSDLTVGADGGVAPTDQPLEMRLHDAAILLAPSHDSWKGLEAQLAADRAAHPDDPRTAVVWAMNLFTKLLRMEAGDPADPATYRRIEDEIEAIALRCLPFLDGQPILQLAAAKLLLATHHGYADLAERTASAALSGSAAFAAALPVLAQALAARGEVEAALARFDQALELCERGSEFEIYLLVLKSQSLIAIDDRRGANAAFERVIQVKPSARARIALFFLEPGELNLRTEQRLLLSRVDREGARRLIAYQHFMVARAFSRPEHAHNLMAGPLDHLVRRFGPTIVPEEVANAYGQAWPGRG